MRVILCGRRYHCTALQQRIDSRHICGFLLFVAIVVWIIVYRTFFYQLYWDTRCFREIREKYSQPTIEPGTKEELIAQFVQLYDVDLDMTSPISGGVLADNLMTCRQVHPDDSTELGQVLKWLSTVKIKRALANIDGKAKMDMYTGHSAKFQFILEGGYKALYKVKKLERDVKVGNLDTGVLGPERHNGEIASYHLQRLLGFNRSPITVGRKVDIVSELLPVADELIKNNTILINGKLCIKLTNKMALGEKETKIDSLCGQKGYLEGVMILWIPRYMRTVPYINPIIPQKDNLRFLQKEYLKYPAANETTKLLDYIDTVILDYLIQNADRHVFYFDPAIYSSILILDNGKSFGDATTDGRRPLDVFSVRCQVRKATYERLKLLSGGVLGAVLRHILSRDPIAPVLLDAHYDALGRRLNILIRTIEDCFTKFQPSYVLVEDDFSYAYKTFGVLSTFYTHYSFDPGNL